MTVGTAARSRRLDGSEDSDAIRLELAPDRAGLDDPAYMTAAVRFR
jgi:hypothetical protein